MTLHSSRHQNECTVIVFEVDLSAELEGAVFEPLQEPAIFASVTIDTTTRTTVWPNGADFAPEFLASLLPQRVSARP